MQVVKKINSGEPHKGSVLNSLHFKNKKGYFLSGYEELESELNKAKEITKSLKEALLELKMKSNYSLPGF